MLERSLACPSFPQDKVRDDIPYAWPTKCEQLLLKSVQYQMAISAWHFARHWDKWERLIALHALTAAAYDLIVALFVGGKQDPGDYGSLFTCEVSMGFDLKNVMVIFVPVIFNPQDNLGIKWIGDGRYNQPRMDIR